MGSVTRKAGIDRGRRREEVEAKLLAAVERLLESGESYTEISVERLAREAGVARSTFYVYFNDKGHLLQKLTEDVIADFLVAASGWWDLLPGGLARAGPRRDHGDRRVLPAARGADGGGRGRGQL